MSNKRWSSSLWWIDDAWLNDQLDDVDDDGGWVGPIEVKLNVLAAAIHRDTDSAHVSSPSSAYTFVLFMFKCFHYMTVTHKLI